MQTTNFQKLITDNGWNADDLNLLLIEVMPIIKDPLWKHRVYLAGGALRRVVAGHATIGEADYDFFFENRDGCNAFRQALLDMGASVQRENSANVTMKLTTEVIEGNDSYEVTFDIQLIYLNFFYSLDELLDAFDFTLCQFGIELGKDDLVYGDTALQDVRKKRLVVNKIQHPVASLRRIIKYSNQGFYMCSGAMTTFLKRVIEQPDKITDTDIQYFD